MILDAAISGRFVLLAQRSTWENLGNRFSGDHQQFQLSDGVTAVAAILMLVAGYWLLTRLSKWQEATPNRPCPRRMLSELGSQHRLSRANLRVCREVAAELSLDQPAEIFVSDKAREALAKRDPQLAKRLFA